jgi:L-alanine-DL-glutamate epimerase-like enolase superfamily enzyme
MKLTFRRFDLHLVDTWRISSQQGVTQGKDFYPVVFVELESEGLSGIGEGAPSSRYNESADTVESFLRKVEPTRLSFQDIPGSMRYLDSVAPGNYTAKAALNLALIDGVAKAAGVPVCDYLKLGFREKRHVTSFSIGIDHPEVIRKKVSRAANLPILKLKVGSADDQRNLRAVREIAPDKTIRLDANEAWRSKEEALHNIEVLAQDKHIEFVEQPMACDSDPKAMAWLKERSPLPLFGDESYHHASDVARCLDCFHGVNVKLVKTGGITGAYDALQAARKAGLKTMIGCMIESSLLITAAAHLAELADHMDLDGNLLIQNDPHEGVSSKNGALSFSETRELVGLRVRPR